MSRSPSKTAALNSVGRGKCQKPVLDANHEIRPQRRSETHRDTQKDSERIQNPVRRILEKAKMKKFHTTKKHPQTLSKKDSQAFL